MSFSHQLQIGKVGESLIAKWFQCRGYNILPVYEKEISENKGPVLFSAEGENIICPDMLVFKKDKILWIEAKHKTAFTWHRISRKWVTGIDLNHYRHYQRVATNLSGWPVYLMFLHKMGTAKDTPDGLISPSGLFGEELLFLSQHENHRHMNWGKSGMVYWNSDTLKKYADLETITERPLK